MKRTCGSKTGVELGAAPRKRAKSSKVSCCGAGYAGGASESLGEVYSSGRRPLVHDPAVHSTTTAAPDLPSEPPGSRAHESALSASISRTADGVALGLQQHQRTAQPSDACATDNLMCLLAQGQRLSLLSSVFQSQASSADVASLLLGALLNAYQPQSSNNLHSHHSLAFQALLGATLSGGLVNAHPQPPVTTSLGIPPLLLQLPSHLVNFHAPSPAAHLLSQLQHNPQPPITRLDLSQGLHIADLLESAAAYAFPRSTREDSGRTQEPHCEETPKSDRRAIPVALAGDRDALSEYQCLLREQICFVEATESDVQATAQGRNKPIKVGQAGIHCRHCSHVSPRHRVRGAAYFPAKLDGIYQAAQNMAINHINGRCENIPDVVRKRLLALKAKKSFVHGGGKQHWASTAEIVGLIETEDGLKFRSREDYPKDGSAPSPSSGSRSKL